MNRFFEEDILSLCEIMELKIQVAEGVSPMAAEEPGRTQLKAMAQLVQDAQKIANWLQPGQCLRRDSFRIPLRQEMVEFLMELLLAELEDLLAPSVSNKWLPMLREDLQKLLVLTKNAQAALREAVQQRDSTAAEGQLRQIPGLDASVPMTPYRHEDACIMISPEDQPPCNISDRVRRDLELQRLQEQLLREQAQLRNDNAQILPPASGEPLPPSPVARDDATKPAQIAPKKERKGLFERLLERKKNQKKQSKTDDVQFRAAAPAMIRPGAFFPVKVMMYREEDHARADREQNALGDQVKASSGSVLQARQDQLFRIALRSPDLPALFESDTLRWNGRYAAVDLDLLLPADFDKEQLRLHCRVYDGDAVVNDLKVILQVNATQPQDLPCEKCVFRSAFISYASEDREQVANRIQGIELAAPDLDLFFDVEDLHRGERWEPRLFHEIEKRDLFYLFWSKNAAASPWVAKELQHAIAHKGLDRIEPVPLETPEECPPPEQLRDRHFNDWTLRYRKK